MYIQLEKNYFHTAVLYQATLLTYQTITNANSLFVLMLVIEHPYYLYMSHYTKVLNGWWLLQSQNIFIIMHAVCGILSQIDN